MLTLIKRLLLVDILRGMWLTFKYMFFKARVTLNYPFENVKLSF